MCKRGCQLALPLTGGRCRVWSHRGGTSSSWSPVFVSCELSQLVLSRLRHRRCAHEVVERESSSSRLYSSSLCFGQRPAFPYSMSRSLTIGIRPEEAMMDEVIAARTRFATCFCKRFPRRPCSEIKMKTVSCHEAMRWNLCTIACRAGGWAINAKRISCGLQVWAHSRWKERGSDLSETRANRHWQGRRGSSCSRKEHAWGNLRQAL